MKLRRPHEPVWIRRLFGSARIDAWLAASVGALTLGAVVGLEIGLTRELRLDRVPDGGAIAAGFVVLLIGAGYARWLLIRLHHDQAPRWRLTPAEGGRLLPSTVTVFWFAGGFASYSSPGDWLLVVVAAVFVGIGLVPPVLRRLASRRAIEVYA